MDPVKTLEPKNKSVMYKIFVYFFNWLAISWLILYSQDLLINPKFSESCFTCGLEIPIIYIISLLLAILPTFLHIKFSNKNKNLPIMLINFGLIIILFAVIHSFLLRNPSSDAYQKVRSKNTLQLRENMDMIFPDISCKKLTNNQQDANDCYSSISLIYNPIQFSNQCALMSIKDNSTISYWECLNKMNKYFFEDDFCSNLPISHSKYDHVNQSDCYTDYFQGEEVSYINLAIHNSYYGEKLKELDIKNCFKINEEFRSRKNCLYYSLVNSAKLNDRTICKKNIEFEKQCNYAIDEIQLYIAEN